VCICLNIGEGVWLDCLVVEHQIHDREVVGTSITNCAVEYSSEQSADAHLLRLQAA